MKHEGGGEGVKLKKLPSKRPASLHLSVDVFLLNRDSVFADWTNWEGDTCQWENDDLKFLSLGILQMIKMHLMGYKIFEFAVKRIPAIRNKDANVFSPKNHLRYYNYW